MLRLLLLPAVALALSASPAHRTTRVVQPLAVARRAVVVADAAKVDEVLPQPQAVHTAAIAAVEPAPLRSAGIATPKLLLATALFSTALVLCRADVALAAAAAVKAASTQTLSMGEILQKAGKKALGGGISGLIAGVIQVCTLMWLRTTMNYQYRNGGGTKEAMSTLWKQGGIGRFYQGLPYALMQAPLSRFGDTAANTGVLTIFAITAPNLPIGLRTAFASAAGSLWRILITPIDTLKTTMQVEGPKAMELLNKKIQREGVMTLYQGALGNAVASFVGSYPWYFTFNALQEAVPAAPAGYLALKLMRNALIGFGATCVSDCISNVIRVLKTTVQTSAEKISYTEAAKQVIDKEGVFGLLTRGLGTRLLTNGIQASMFSVLWKVFEEMAAKKGL